MQIELTFFYFASFMHIHQETFLLLLTEQYFLIYASYQQ